MQIRKATESDIEMLVKLSTDTFIESFGYLYKPDELQEFVARRFNHDMQSAEITTEGSVVYIASINGIPAGYARICNCRIPVDNLDAGALELHKLYVLREYQNGGIGRALIKTALQAVDRAIYVGVWSRNIKAQQLYASFGFVICGGYKFYVGTQADDEFIMKRCA